MHIFSSLVPRALGCPHFYLCPLDYLGRTAGLVGRPFIYYCFGDVLERYNWDDKIRLPTARGFLGCAVVCVMSHMALVWDGAPPIPWAFFVAWLLYYWDYLLVRMHLYSLGALLLVYMLLNGSLLDVGWLDHRRSTHARTSGFLVGSMIPIVLMHTRIGFARLIFCVAKFIFSSHAACECC
jgi:hypothetical protein